MHKVEVYPTRWRLPGLRIEDELPSRILGRDADLQQAPVITVGYRESGIDVELGHC